MNSSFKKIVIFTNKFLPYSETFIKNHIENLKQYKPIIIASDALTDGLSVDVSENEKLFLTNAKYGKLNDIGFKLGFLSLRVKKFLRQHLPVLIHSHFGQHGYSSLLISRYFKIPHLTTFHGFDITVNDFSKKKVGWLHSRFRRNIKKLQKHGTHFIAVSDFVANKLIERGFEKDKITRCYLGINTDQFKADDSIIRDKKIVCIARHVEYKGINYLIDAMVHINKKLPEAQLVLIGDGPLTETLKAQAHTLNINCIFKGRLPSEQVKAQLNSAAVYCQPSVRLNNGHEEALALTIVEAQAMGVPAVVFNTGGMPEAIIDEQSGFVVNEKNITELAEKLTQLLTNENLWQQFSINAKEQVHNRHCLVKQTEKLEKLYTSLIGNKH